jgi:hypothetical protein
MKWFETIGFFGTQSKHLFNKKLKAISLQKNQNPLRIRAFLFSEVIMELQACLP